MAGMIKLPQSGYDLKLDGLFGGFLSKGTFVCFLFFKCRLANTFYTLIGFK